MRNVEGRGGAGTGPSQARRPHADPLEASFFRDRGSGPEDADGADLVGRRPELSAIGRWFADDTAPASLVLEGEAGLGKTTVWAAAIRAIRESGQPVLTSAPVEAESRLSYSGLADLVAGALPSIRAALPGPQATAIAVAVRIDEPGDRPADETAVARGWLEAQRYIARAPGRLLVAIDDVRWLDGPSLEVVAYALRRLRPGDRVKILLTHRTGAVLPASLSVDELGERVRLGPVSLGAIHRIIRVRAGLSLPRPRLLEVYTASGGNPLHALELARASGTGGATDRSSIGELFAARLATLPREARRAILLIAASSDRSTARLERAWGPGFEAVIEPAVDADLVTVVGSVARPIHPLVTHVAYEEAGDGPRREAHRRLAETASTAEERAIHLSRSVLEPDTGAASLLEAAAVDARARGVRPLSATLSESSARLTPPGEAADRARRLLAASASWFEAGDPDRVEEILRPLLAELEPGDQASEAGWRLGVALDESGRWQEAIALWRAALDGAGDAGLRSQLQCSLAITAFYTESVQVAGDWADRAVAAAEEAGDPRRLAESLAVQALTMSMRGDAGYRAVIERALVIEAGVPDLLGEWSPSAVAAESARLSGDVAAAAGHYSAVLDRAIRIGDANIEQWASFGLASSELLLGNLRRASDLAETVLDLADQTGVMRIPALSLRAQVDAYLGRIGPARELVRAATERAASAQEATHLFGAHVIGGIVETAAGDHVAAAGVYARARAIATELGLGHATALRSFLGEAEEAAAAGFVDQAVEALAAFELAVGGSPPGWAASLNHRARGAVLAAQGDLHGARTALDRAAVTDAALPIDQARALLALGAVCRRLREYGRAREALGSAISAFEAIGTPPWVERARGELARVPGRRAADGAGLTGAETRIAELVAAGQSNKDVAAELFLSVKTVEVTMTRVYAKLGLRSRTELAAVYRGAGDTTPKIRDSSLPDPRPGG